jgi:hypothetical protein
MNFKRILNTDLGRIIISILLGLGLATVFKKVCNDKSCMTFNGPVISQLEGKIYKHDNKCYSYTSNPVTCNASKRVLEISIATPELQNPEPKGIFG